MDIGYHPLHGGFLYPPRPAEHRSWHTLHGGFVPSADDMRTSSAHGSPRRSTRPNSHFLGHTYTKCIILYCGVFRKWFESKLQEQRCKTSSFSTAIWKIFQQSAISSSPSICRVFLSLVRLLRLCRTAFRGNTNIPRRFRDGTKKQRRSC